MEKPVFRLGLIGFTGAEEQRLRAAAERYRQADWQCGRPEGADAWLINGPRVGRTHDARVRVIAPEIGTAGAALVVDVSSRPTAVAAPAPQSLQHLVGLTFDLRQADSVSACLAALDAHLGPMRRLYWVAAHLVQQNEMVSKAVYELRAGSRLLAVADMKGTVSISPELDEARLDAAVWKHRARKAIEVPMDFEQHPFSELLWIYGTRTRLDLLPERYADCPIYLRRPPRVRTELVGDLHLRIIRELALAPARVSELEERLGADVKDVRRALAALYYVGSVTANPDRAWAASSQQGDLAAMDGRPVEERGHVFNRPSEGQPSTAPLL